MADAPGTPLPESFDRRERFGSFEILRDATGAQTLLGKGTFGRTYQARHVFLERTVALKIINDRFLTDAAARQRFLVEARAAAKLAHPHIAQILDFGETDGILFYAMEYCSGGDLAAFVKRHGELSVVQAMQVGIQVASALQCAHSAGFIHRDLKPSNVMLAASGGTLVTKLIDFGLVIAAPAEDAPPVDPDSIPTIEQRFIGTPLFASPEQLLSEPLDARSDFFSLGMTLWFLLIGTAPDQGNSAAIMTSRISAESYADRLPRKLPRPLVGVLARLLEKKPENRFANATEVLNAFAACATRLGMPAPQLGAVAAAEPAESERDLPPLPTVEMPAPVEDSYAIVAQGGESLTGANYEVRAAGDPEAVAPFWLHVLKGSLTENLALMERFRANAAAFALNPALVRPLEFRSHPDATVVLLEKPAGLDLLTELKTAGPLPLAEARGLLQQIAQTCDSLAEAALPTPEMDGNRIFLEHAPTASAGATGALLTATPRLFPRFLTQRETSTLAAGAGAHSSAATVTYEMMMEERVDAPGWQFAMLIYRVVSGRNCTIAASLSPQNYVAVPALSEESNRILANAIARQLVHPTSVGLLADLLIAEGLMGGLATRTHSSTAHPSATAGASSAGFGAAASALVSATASAAAWETAGHTTHFSNKLFPRSLQPVRGEAPPPDDASARQARRRWIGVVGITLLALLAGAFVYQRITSQPETTSTPTPLDIVGSAEVRLQGDLPAHTRAVLDGREIALQRDTAGWLARIVDSQAPFPAVLSLQAKGFKSATVELPDRVSLQAPQTVEIKRSEGTLLFTRLAGSDYDHATFRMTAQLPDEQAFVELARYPLGASFGSEGKVRLPTGIYQVILQGANPGIVRSRAFETVAIRPDETAACALPLPIAGTYAGAVVVRSPAGEKTRSLELAIEPGLAGGAYREGNARGGRKITLSDGRLEADGTYTARLDFSAVADVESQFDQLFSLKRLPDGAAEYEAAEAPDVNPTIEPRLRRRPYDRSTFSVKGTLMPTARQE